MNCHSRFCRLGSVSLLLLACACAVFAQSRSSQLIRIYRQSKDLATAGRTQEAIRLLSDNIVYDDRVLQEQKTLAETNARLLSLLAGLLHKPGVNEEQLFKAESYAAWAISGSYCEATYWKQYVDIRLDRETYAPMIGALRRKESTKYPLQPMFPRQSDQHLSRDEDWSTSFPDSKAAPLLEALTYIRLGETDRALPILTEYKEKVNICPINDILAELDLMNGNPKQTISYIDPELADAGFGISAYRLVLYGQAQRTTGDLDGARRSFTEALRVDDSVYDAESALQAMASGAIGDPRMLEGYLTRNPEDWRGWSRLWGTQSTHARTGIEEFLRFARSEDANTSVAPRLAQGLVSLYFHDVPSALDDAEVAFRRRSTSDGAFAQLVLHLLKKDYRGAANDFEVLSSLDSKTTLRLKQLGCNRASLSQLVRNADPPAGQIEVGKLLLRISEKFPENGYAQTAFGVFASELPQQTSGGILVSLLMDNVIAEGQTSEKRYQTYLRDYASLRSGLAIQEARTSALQTEMTEIDVQLKTSVQRLVALIDQRDQRLSADMDRLAGLVAELRGTPQGQQLELADLAGWRNGSAQDAAQQVVRMSGVLAALSNAVSVDASFSRVEFNMVGVLADILMIAGA